MTPADRRLSEGAALLAVAMGICLPPAAALPHAIHERQHHEPGDDIALKRAMTDILDAMVDSAIIGIDLMTAPELAFELCRPRHLIDAALDKLIQHGHIRAAKKVFGRTPTPYILCRMH